MAAAPNDSQPTFPPLPGVDIAQGLQRALNRPALYRRLVDSFRASHAGTAAAIAAALAAGDAAGAARLAHAFKGAAATIAAEGLSALALAVERECRAGNESACAEAAAQLGSDLTVLVAAIDRLPPVPPAGG